MPRYPRRLLPPRLTELFGFSLISIVQLSNLLGDPPGFQRSRVRYLWRFCFILPIPSSSVLLSLAPRSEWLRLKPVRPPPPRIPRQSQWRLRLQRPKRRPLRFFYRSFVRSSSAAAASCRRCFSRSACRSTIARSSRRFSASYCDTSDLKGEREIKVSDTQKSHAQLHYYSCVYKFRSRLI